VEAVYAIADKLPQRWRACVLVAAGLGLRPGEIFGLRVADVDFLRRVVTVERQLDDHGTLVEPKTAASYRTVPLPDVVGTTLATHLAVEGR
jgi:integrase